MGETNVVVPQTNTGTVAKTVTPTATVTQPSLAQRVNAANGQTARRPQGLTLGNTRELNKGFFRFVLYSETNARKTTTAAMFDTPEFVRIILTRRPEQLIPLMEAGYQYVHCEDAQALLYALKYPEQIWPDWATMADPEGRKTLIVDDITKGVAMLVESNSGSKDRRQAYTGAFDDLDSAIVSLSKKPYNLGLIALAKVKENSLTNEEEISPDLPPSMKNYILAEFEGVFFINPRNWKLLTDRDRFAFQDVDPTTQKEKTFVRSIFAKVKVPVSALATVKKEEELSLGKLWAKIKSAKGQAK